MYWNKLVGSFLVYVLDLKDQTITSYLDIKQLHLSRDQTLTFREKKNNSPF